MTKRKRTTWLARGIVPVLTGALLAGAPSMAQADTAEHKAMAQTLFDQARALIAKKQFPEACPKLAQSLRLDPGIGTMLWLADCYENNGQTASSWALFKEAAAAAALQRDAREAVARRRASTVEPRLTKLVINVPPDAASVPGFELTRDGEIVDHVELGVASPLDPGAHTLSARAPGRVLWSTTIELPAHAATIAVEVPILAEAIAPPLVTVVAAPPIASTSQAEAPVLTRPQPGLAAPRVLGLSLAAAGVLSIGAGAFLGLTAKSTYDTSNQDGHCLPTNECDATGKSRRSQAGGLALGSSIAFGGGAALLAGGALLYLLTGRRDSENVVSVTPAVDTRAAGVTFHRVW
jgi:hypothetical protein